MHYKALDLVIPAEKREQFNRKILHVIRSGDLQGLSHEEIFNAYTGKGGLHGESFNSYNSYHAYAEAKRAVEQGQFFTPDAVAEFLAESLDLRDTDLILDPAAGHGALLNHVPLLARAHANELDADAVTVGRFLFPQATWERGDFLTYHPKQGRYQVVLTNPPYNLRTRYKGEPMLSQEALLRRATEWLTPGGIIALIVPEAFLNDAYAEKSLIEWVDSEFSFVAQTRLPEDAFKRVGVEKFATKILYLQRVSVHLARRPLDPGAYLPFDLATVKAAVSAAREAARGVRAKLRLEDTNQASEDAPYRYRAEKLLFHIAANPKTRAEAARCNGMIDELERQERPPHLSHEEWEAQRLTWPKVIRELKRVLRSQHLEERDEVRLVRHKHRLRLKPYSGVARVELEASAGEKEWNIHQLAVGVVDAPPEVRSHPLYKAVRDRERLYQAHATPLPEIAPDPALVARLQGETILHPESRQPFHPSRLQAEDIARVLTRRYSFLSWQQGTGKTLAGYLWSRYAPARATIICAPALAIERTWAPFLEAQGQPFKLVTDRQGALGIEAGDVVLLSWRRVVTLRKWLKRSLKRLGNKVNLLVDEGDELCNYHSQQTQAMLAVFRRAKRKLVMTGTATRNTPRDLYPNLELLYNNATLMLCTAETLQMENKKGELEERSNEHYLLPFPARSGARVFSATYSPRRTSVFGVQKDNQDLYNAASLLELLDRTRLTRTFNEVVGEGLYSLHQHAVEFAPAEARLHETLIKDFQQFLDMFAKTEDHRKDSALRAVRQLRLLIEACAHPHLFEQYEGSERASRKMHAVTDLINSFPGQQVAVGVTRRQVFGWPYLELWKAHIERETGRAVHVIHGGHSFAERGEIIQRFQGRPEDVLLCTQDSLKSSVNIPSVNRVIIPMLQWNLPRIAQYFFRFIRMDMTEPTQVHFITYERSIEGNLLALLLRKERLNAIIREGQLLAENEIGEYLNLPDGLLDELLTKEVDHEGNVKINWSQRVSA